jgi:hypothetical protein
VGEKAEGKVDDGVEMTMLEFLLSSITRWPLQNLT